MEWIPLKYRTTTDEEQERYNCDSMLDCEMPEDGDTVLLSVRDTVCTDVFCNDGDGCYFESFDFDEIDAWMPLPKPYKAE